MATGFEGYWRNAEAEQARVKNGWYWTGDLGYRDEDDFFYFGGRDYDWLRVDGENFASAPVEGILQRHPDVVLASVYAVPDTVVGDQVMATLLLREGRAFDPDGLRRVPGRRGGPRHQVGAPLRAGDRQAARDGHHQGASSGSCATRRGTATSRCGGARPRTPPTAGSTRPTSRSSTGPSPSADGPEPLGRPVDGAACVGRPRDAGRAASTHRRAATGTTGTARRGRGRRSTRSAPPVR